MDNKTLKNRDLSVLWHPCTQMHDHAIDQLPLIPIRKGEGIWLEDYDGNRYIDAISSWWVNLFGHANPRISTAVSRQAETLEHVLLAGCTHEPVIQLSERLLDLTPNGLDRCFYGDNGSSVVEIALKMSFHYWHNLGQHQRSKFITLTNSYHGETLGALAVGDVGLYKNTYEPLLMQTIAVHSPDCYHRQAGQSWKDYSLHCFAEMEQTLAQHANEVCAVIVEPLIQCAGSMRMYHPIYLRKLREACDHYQVHLIADEIAVGFGRTGTLFACQQADISPDFLCLGKGLTGGYLPLAVCLTTDNIYQAFYAEHATAKAFLHSHSYTGNPLACAAALATLDIFRDDDVINNNKKLAQALQQNNAVLQDHPHIAEVRQTGMVLAIEMVQDKATKKSYPAAERRGLQVYRHALKKGALLRPLGDVIYMMPPYIIKESEIKDLSAIAANCIDIVTA